MTSGHEMQELEDIDKELVFQEYDNRALLSENKKSRGETSGEQTSSSGGGGGAGGYFSLSFYQQFFDVDTTTVGTRLLKSVIPTPSPFYSDQGEQTPDLYGPFWVVTTLVFVVGVVSNLNEYIHHSSQSPWKSNYQLMTTAAVVLYAWATLVPLVLWFLLKRIQEHKDLVTVLSIYGYSFTPYIVSILLCSIPLSLVKWISIVAAVALSSLFLLRNFWNTLAAEKKQISLPVLVMIVAAHAAFSLFLKLYFFYY